MSKGMAPPNKLPLKTATCKQCGVDFQFPGSTKSRVFCSHFCHSESQIGKPTWNAEPKIIKVCRECGKEFQVHKCRTAIAFYCSYDCAHLGKTRRVGIDHPLYKEPTTLTCEQCGGTFEAKFCFGPEGTKAGEKKFCSRSCAGSASAQKQGGRRSSIELQVEAELLRLGESFEHSKPLGPWLVDFFIADKNLVVECDGFYWHSIPEIAARDIRKNEWMQQRGYRIARIEEMDIRDDITSAVQRALNLDCRCTMGIGTGEGEEA